MDKMLQDYVYQDYSSSSSFTGKLNSLIDSGVQAERANTQVPLSHPYMISKMYFRTGQHSLSLNEINFYKLYKVVSATFIILGFCLSKPMNPNFIIYTPPILPSQIHFCTLQLFAKYSWKTKVPCVFFISSIQAPSVDVYTNDLIRHSSTFPQFLTFTPSILTAVQISISSTVILTYFFKQSISYSAYSAYSPYSPQFFYFSYYYSSLSLDYRTSPDLSKSLKTWVYLVAVKQWSLILPSSEGMLLVVFSLAVNMSKQVNSASSSPGFFQFYNKIKLPSFYR